MNPTQIQEHINMIKYVNLYIHNTDLAEIARDVFNADELTNYYIDYIERLQNNFMTVQDSMNKVYFQNLIQVSYNKYHK